MRLLTVQGQTFNLAHLVRYTLQTSQSEVGSRADRLDPLPLFADLTFARLYFSEGLSVQLEEVQTQAFLAFIKKNSETLDLDRVETQAVGTVLVHNTAEGGDIVLPTEPPTNGTDGNPPFEPGVFPPLR